MAALVPSGNIDGKVTIDADVMIMREHQEDATCITLANDKSTGYSINFIFMECKMRCYRFFCKNPYDGSFIWQLVQFFL